MARWQDELAKVPQLITDALRQRRARFHGPFYATGWLAVKAVSLGKQPNERWPDTYVFFVGLAIWLAVFAVYWISN